MWVSLQKTLLQLELDEERSNIRDALDELSADECQLRGISLLGLEIQEYISKSFNKSIVRLGRPNGNLPSTKIGQGDDVQFYPSRSRTSDNLMTGVISQMAEDFVDVMVNADTSDLSEMDCKTKFRLDIRPNESTHHKLMTALDTLEILPRCHNIRGKKLTAMFIDSPPSTTPDNIQYYASKKEYPTYPGISPINSNLNPSQIDAVSFALSSTDVCLIHGPPGTGKTTVVIELILQILRQAFNRNTKILVCAPSNVAVDNILERLIPYASAADSRSSSVPLVKPIRIGHSSRISAAAVAYSLDSIIENDEDSVVVSDLRREIKRLKKVVDADHRNKNAARELKQLRGDAREREDRIQFDIVRRSNVILSTNVSAMALSRIAQSSPDYRRSRSRDLNPIELICQTFEFDVTIIDEAAQALEVSCWIPILMSPKCVLVGDHKQLPPTIKSEEAAKNGLSVTLFERLMYGGFDCLKLDDNACPDLTNDERNYCVSRLLQIQYRMHPLISDWSSEAMYNGLIVTDESVLARPACTAINDTRNGSDASNDDDCLCPIMMIDTSGCEYFESELETDDGKQAGFMHLSRSNLHEVELVRQHVKTLITKYGFSTSDIAVITPYNAQVEELKKCLHSDAMVDYLGTLSASACLSPISIRTVDGFQGGERDAVVISLVRSNPYGNFGFLKDDRRLNVAITRAKRHVCVICDTETVGQHPFIKTLIDYMNEKGEVKSALEFASDEVINQLSSGDIVDSVRHHDTVVLQVNPDRIVVETTQSVTPITLYSLSLLSDVITLTLAEIVMVTVALSSRSLDAATVLFDRSKFTHLPSLVNTQISSDPVVERLNVIWTRMVGKECKNKPFKHVVVALVVFADSQIVRLLILTNAMTREVAIQARLALSKLIVGEIVDARFNYSPMIAIGGNPWLLLNELSDQLRSRDVVVHDEEEEEEIVQPPVIRDNDNDDAAVVITIKQGVSDKLEVETISAEAVVSRSEKKEIKKKKKVETNHHHRHPGQDIQCQADDDNNVEFVNWKNSMSGPLKPGVAMLLPESFTSIGEGRKGIAQHPDRPVGSIEGSSWAMPNPEKELARKVLRDRIETNRENRVSMSAREMAKRQAEQSKVTGAAAPVFSSGSKKQGPQAKKIIKKKK